MARVCHSQETNIGRGHSKNFVFDKDAAVLTYEQKKQAESDIGRPITEFFVKKEKADKPEEKLKRDTKRYVR